MSRAASWVSVSIAKALRAWYGHSGRVLPWRKTTDPYAILVSELMLQQTQVDRVVPKYNAWLARFPDWQALAQAKRSDVLRAWSGLGYNTRAVRLHVLAKMVVEEMGGRLPASEAELVKLPGIGPYTAGAVMCFAHNMSGRCIDVNVERAIKRLFFSQRERPGSEDVELALAGLLKQAPRPIANALMDLGSAYCTASSPKCDGCPLHSHCRSRGERPEEAALRVSRRQKQFLHSNRWWRGQILKALARGAGMKQTLFSHIDCDDIMAFEKALEQLQAEGLVSGKVRLKLSD